MVKTVELIYNAVEPALIAPFSFSENLVTYSMADSQLVTDMNGHSGPAGSYWYLKTWMPYQAKHQAQIPVDGNLVFVFDNNHVIGKSYHAKPNNKVSNSVITSVAAVNLEDTQLQNNAAIKPGVWAHDTQLEDIEAQMKPSTSNKKTISNKLKRTQDERIKNFRFSRK